MTVVDTQSVLRLSAAASIQTVGDGAVVLLIDSGQLYTCNATTETMLKLVDGKRSLADIVTLALEEYDTDRATLQRDFQELAGELIREGILII